MQPVRSLPLAALMDCGPRIADVGSVAFSEGLTGRVLLRGTITIVALIALGCFPLKPGAASDLSLLPCAAEMNCLPLQIVMGLDKSHSAALGSHQHRIGLGSAAPHLHAL